MSGYDFSQEAANELLESADKKNDALVERMARLRDALSAVVKADQLHGHTATSGEWGELHDGPCAEIARRALDEDKRADQ